MASVTGLTLVKSMVYRGDPTEEFSNTYHFKLSPPSDDTAWTTLMNSAIAKEKPIINATSNYVRCYGYDSDDPNAHHVFAYIFADHGTPPAGTYPVDSSHRLAGDQAAMVEWKTSRLNSRGKPIYLRKYFHAGDDSSSNSDQLSAAYKTALDAFVNLSTGINSVGGGLRSRTHDETLITSSASQWTTTRTLKRRGKRPRTGS